MTAGSARGFSLLELLVALTLALVVVSGAFSLAGGANGAFARQPEAADVQQRLRAVTTALTRDLAAAGGTSLLALGSEAQTPVSSPSVFPMRVGRLSADAPGTFSPSRISLWSLSTTGVQARLATPMLSASGTASILPGGGCRSGAASCGFQPGMVVVVLGSAGAWDLFTVTGVAGTALTLQHNLRDSATVHPAFESSIAEATTRSFMLKDDVATSSPRVVRYDLAGGSDVPVVDHVVALTFEYVGEADPPQPVIGADPTSPRVTYGPPPPAPGVQPTLYPPGENCAFVRTTTGVVASRLPVLGATGSLVTLPPNALVDGPWCPDAGHPNRYDADLLRVRGVIATVRVEAAVDSLRGPAGRLFARGGTGSWPRVVPDRVARLVVFPRALSAWR